MYYAIVCNACQMLPCIECISLYVYMILLSTVYPSFMNRQLFSFELSVNSLENCSKSRWVNLLSAGCDMLLCVPNARFFEGYDLLCECPAETRLKLAEKMQACKTLQEKGTHQS